jgi:hypothetical protein
MAQQPGVAELMSIARGFPEFTAAGGDWWVDAPMAARYLRARKGDVGKAAEMLHNTLKWRLEFKPDDIKWQDVALEHETGKMYANGYDREGHPILVMRPRNENTKGQEGQLLNLVYILNTAIRLMSPGVEQWVLVLDFGGYSLKNAPPMKTSRAVLDIMQNHFPERLARAVLLDPPTLFYASYKIVEPFVDKHTREKVCFLRGKPEQLREQLNQYFDLSKLEQGLSGDLPYTYNHAQYGAQRSQEDEIAAQQRAQRAAVNAAPAVGQKEVMSL